MRIKYLFVFLLLVCVSPVRAQVSPLHAYDGWYWFQIDMPDDPSIRIETNTGLLELEGNQVTAMLTLRYSSTTRDPEANYVYTVLRGSGRADVTGSLSVTAKTSGFVFAYDSGALATKEPVGFDLSGTLSSGSGGKTISGTLTFNNNGKVTKTVSITALNAVVPEEMKYAGTFSSISGQVEVLLPGETEWTDAKMEMELPEGTRVKTAMESSCVIAFKDLSVFSMKEETQLQLAVLREDNSKIKLVWGKLMTNVRKMFRDGKMEIATTQAVAGIKGTVLVLEATPAETRLKVLEGTVEMTSLENAAIRMVHAGETVAAVADGLTAVNSFGVTEERSSWAALSKPGGSNKNDNNPAGASAKKDYSEYYVVGGIVVFILIAYLVLGRRIKLKG